MALSALFFHSTSTDCKRVSTEISDMQAAPFPSLLITQVSGLSCNLWQGQHGTLFGSACSVFVLTQCLVMFSALACETMQIFGIGSNATDQAGPVSGVTTRSH